MEAIKKALDRHTAEDANKVPGAQISVVNVKGAPLIQYATGKIARNEKPEEKRDLDLDDIYRAFSTGKLLVVIMALQLVERSLLDLDDPSVIEKHFPEMTKLKILDGYVDAPDTASSKKPNFKDRQKPITPRMLLDHTSGITNGWMDREYREYRSTIPPMRTDLDPVDAFWETITNPEYFFLLSEPGNFRYTFGPDMFGIMAERLSGQSLAQYYEKNITGPLGLKNTYVKHFHEATPASEHLYTPYIRGPNGDLTPTLYPGGSNYNRTPLPPYLSSYKNFPDSDKHGYLASNCVYTNASDYATILAALLNNGVSPATGARILSAESVQEMARPSLKAEQLRYTKFAEDGPMEKELDMETLNPGGNIGLACAIQGNDRVLSGTGAERGMKGRKAGSAYWYGLGNAQWWIDWESGIAAVVASHYLPWNDGAFMDMMEEVEGAIYDALED